MTEEQGIKATIIFYAIGALYSLYLIFNLISQGPLSNLEHPMTAKDMIATPKASTVAERIAPVGKTKLAGQEEKAAPVAKKAAAPAVAKTGEQVYSTVCFACHGTGVMNAPKKGNKDNWAPRLANGIDALVKSAIHGKGSMPPRGGNASLSDQEIKNAIEFMTTF